MHTNSSPQWLIELRQLWPSVPWQVACEPISWYVPTLCLHSSIVSPLWLCWVKSVCMFRCNLAPALLAEWPGSFTCHCHNTWVECRLIKSQHTKLTQRRKFSLRSCSQPFSHESSTPQKKILPPLLLGFELATFQSQVRHSNQQAILAHHVKQY